MGESSDARRVVFLRGHKVILRPLDKARDADVCQRWINDPDVNQFLLAHRPITPTGEAEWFDQVEKSDEVHLAIEADDGVFIGLMGIHEISWKDRRATTGALIGEKAYWGQGYGTDAKMTLLDYAFNTLNLRKICSSVLEFNERSLQYNLHCGYRIEGRRREQFFRNGRYWDEILLGLFREDWEPVWARYRETGSVYEETSEASEASSA